MSLVSRFLEKRSENNPGGEMGFVDHLESLRWHILRSLLALAVGAVVAFANIQFIFHKIILGPSRAEFVSYKYLCKLGEMVGMKEMCMDENLIRFQNTKLTGQFMLSFSSAAMIGFIIAFPYIFWEFWRFIKPALKENELKQARGMVFWGTLLFMTGVCFGYFVVVPFAISFFSQYIISTQFENIILISDYYDLTSNLILGLGVVFEIPILVYFLSKIGILTPSFLREKRRYAIVLILVVSALITPPDWFSIFLVFLPLYGLYEISIIVSARINRARMKAEGISENDKDLDW